MMRAAVIVNPAKADVPDLREPVDKTLAAAGCSTPLWLETTPEDPGRGMAEAAVAADVQLVVICGGDGTVMACLGALAGTDVPVAVVPLGTGNLLARNLGVPTRLADALAVAVNGVDRRIDLGRVADQPFAVMAGIGFDAAMMADATEDMKRFAGWPAYVASALRHLRDPVMRVRLHIDDGPPLRRLARTVLVGNVGRLQGGLELLPDAAVDDGLLDVVVVAPRTLRDWIRLAWRVLRRHRTRDPHLERFRGCSVLVEANRIVPRQMDGEVIDHGRNLDARIEPGALVIRVPQPVATAA
jgi:YegS/Rv2252/BmrU family lipid kinase